MNKKIILVLLMVLFAGADLMACDMCSSFQGINPTGRVNQIGLRYRFRSFSGQHAHIGSVPGHLHSPAEAEFYHTLEAWGRWYPIRRLMLTAQMPFSISRENTPDGGYERVVGQGDLSLAAYVGIYESPSSNEGSVYQRLFVGGGVKLPTGLYNSKSELGYLNPLSQPGTGSFDFFGGLNYMIKYKWAGVLVDASYKYNLPNKNEYHFADRVNVNGNFFAKIRKKDWVLLPHAGMYWEMAGTDQFSRFEMANTGGSALFVNLGMDVYFKKFAVQFTGQIPCWENLNGVQGSNQFRLNTGIAWSLGQG